MINFISYLTSFIQKWVFPYKLVCKVKDLSYVIFSLWIRSLFLSCPQSVRFQRIGLLVGAKYISIGESTSFQKDLYLTAWDSYGHQSFSPQILIGDNCRFGAWNHISSTNMIIIGDNFLSGKWVTIVDNSHGMTDIESLKIPPKDRKIFSKGPVIIGNNVWVGDHVTILPGVTIGDNVVIAANSVVSHNIPSFSIVAGVPARLIK